jgi:hypothetical protein
MVESEKSVFLTMALLKSLLIIDVLVKSQSSIIVSVNVTLTPKHSLNDVWFILALLKQLLVRLLRLNNEFTITLSTKITSIKDVSGKLHWMNDACVAFDWSNFVPEDETSASVAL